MRILAIAEHYPSPFKPYHDTQFERFVLDGHELVICAFGAHHGDLHPAVKRHGLDRNITHLPSTMKHLPGTALPLLRSLLMRPMTSLPRLHRVWALGGSPRQRLFNAVRALLMPGEAPTVCIVHNLRAFINTQFLKAIYPQSVVTFYYHGGEVPGVPQLSVHEAARAFSYADVVFTNTESSKENAVERGCVGAKINISPVGFNFDNFPDPGMRGYRRDGVLNLLMAGRLSEEKGMMLGVRALQEILHLGHQAVRLRIIGEGPQEGALRAFVAEHALGRYIELVGRVSHERLLDEYRRADVLMLPSIKIGTWQENQACVVQEALLMRAVVAVSRTGGVPESTAPEMLEYSFAPGDVGGLVASLQRLLSLGEADLRRLGVAGRQFVEGRYDIRGLNAQLLEIAVGISPLA